MWEEREKGRDTEREKGNKKWDEKEIFLFVCLAFKYSLPWKVLAEGWEKMIVNSIRTCKDKIQIIAFKHIQSTQNRHDEPCSAYGEFQWNRAGKYFSNSIGPSRMRDFFSWWLPISPPGRTSLVCILMKRCVSLGPCILTAQKIACSRTSFRWSFGCLMSLNLPAGDSVSSRY